MAHANNKARKAELARKIRAHKGAMGVVRKAHFGGGGSLAGWRGTANVYTDRRKAASKKACRRKVQW